MAHANGSCVLERRVEGTVVNTVAPTESPCIGESETLTLAADVSNTEAVFSVGTTPLLTVPILSIDAQGSPGIWVSGNAAQLETFEVTLPASAVGQ